MLYDIRSNASSSVYSLPTLCGLRRRTSNKLQQQQGCKQKNVNVYLEIMKKVGAQVKKNSFEEFGGLNYQLDGLTEDEKCRLVI